MTEAAYKDIQSPSEADALMQPDAGPVVIDFWAPWCGPCKAMAPHYEAVAKEMKDSPVRFFKVNTQDHPEIGKAFQITAYPTVLFIHNGEFFLQQIGAASAPLLLGKAKKLLNKAEGKGGFFSRLFGG